MPAPQYVCNTEGAVALSAATARSVVGAKAHANSGLVLCGFSVSFDGVTASAVPVLVEVMYSTFATKPPGTNSTSTTPRQVNGRVLAAGFTSGSSWAAANEPTVLTPAYDEFTLSAVQSTYKYNWPLGTEPDCALGEGFVIRCTAPATVNVRAGLLVSRC